MLFSKLQAWFETRVSPYPDALLQLLEKELLDKALSTRALLLFLWRCSDGFRAWLLVLMLLSTVLAAMEAYLFHGLGQLVNGAMEAGRLDALLSSHAYPLMVLLVLVLLQPLLTLFHSLIKFQTLQGAFPMRLRWQFHRLMLRQSLAFYQDEFAGRVSSKVMQTALAVRDSIVHAADLLVYIVVYVGGGLWVVGNLGGHLIWPLVIWVLCYLGCIVYFIPRLKRSAMLQADARALMTGRITDAYTNISVVKLFAHNSREEEYVKHSMASFLDTVHIQMRLVTRFEVTNQTLNSLFLLSTAGLALWQWRSEPTAIGAMAAALALALRLQGMSQWILWEIAGLFENIGIVQDGMKTLSSPCAVLDAPGASTLQVKRGGITFKQLQFAYPNGKIVFNDFNLQIAPGEKVGIVGRSGSGKSTLVNLLLRFYDIQAGAIEIDGQDVRSVEQESLRRQIAMVTQDASLLHRSVRDNIAYGRPEATQEQIVAAAQNAHAWEFIQGLSDKEGRSGLDVMVGERGVKLSGGQRQRIAIARVMLKNAPILVLDEATSALDSEVEAAIQESLHDLMQGKTVLAIAHRLSTIAKMDRLIVLEQGRILEQGSHSELLAQNGLYASLWQRQTGDFLKVD